ncbi:MAG TPA: NUDIX domain-containing protein [Phormidium sp.]
MQQSQFDEKNERVVFQSNPPWVQVKQTVKGFFFLERKGKDSVAVFLIRKNPDTITGYEVLIRLQPLPLDNSDNQKLYACPVTGSLDEGENIRQCALREVQEETGYKLDSVKNLGAYIVGSQVNEFCYMFYSDVTGMIPGDAPQDGGYDESISKNVWVPMENLNHYDYSACQIGYLRLIQILENQEA